MPQLRIIKGENKDSHYILSPSPAIIGRIGGDILIPDSQVSSQHARIYCTDDGWMIEDLNSTNGTFINGRIVDEVTCIGVNDLIRVGNTILIFESAGQSKSMPKKSGSALAISAMQLTDGKPHLIGRDPSADIYLNEAIVSRKHAILQFQNGTVIISDCGSLSGTYVNGRRISQHILVQADKVQIGATEFLFSPHSGFSLCSPKGPIRLDVDQVSHCVTYRGAERTLLDGISFSVLPGEFVVVVGGSGTGKTSLFRVLTGLELPTIGKVTLNGIEYHSHHRRFSGQVGFVPQDDIVHGDLTIRTALTYAAKLRLPHDTSENKYEQRVNSVLEAVRLTHRIDSDIKLLSGGERKRVNVALELLTEPNLLFLDEPTSGLDPHHEKQMMKLMQKLASEGRTVLLTTHSVQSLELCDLLLIMGAGGHIVYYGPPQKALSHFNVSSYEEIYGRIGDTPEEALGWQYAFWRSSTYKQYGAMRSPSRQVLPSPQPSEYSNTIDVYGWFRQFILLSQRYFSILSRDYALIAFLLAQAPVLAFLITLVYSNKSFDTAVTNPDGTFVFAASARMVIFLMAFLPIWFGTINSVQEIVKEAPIVIRERLAFLRPSAYLCSKFLVLSVFCLIQCISMVLVFGARMEWFHVDATTLLTMTGVLFLTSLAGLSMGLAISTLSRTPDQALVITPLAIVPQILFAGLLLPDNNSSLVKILKTAHISYWSYSSLGLINNLNEKLHSLVPFYKDNLCFTGDLHVKLLVIALLFMTFAAVALLGVSIKRSRV